MIGGLAMCEGGVPENGRKADWAGVRVGRALGATAGEGGGEAALGAV